MSTENRMENCERAAVKYFAAKLGLTIDTQIFRGELPAAVCDAVCVMADSAARGNTPTMHTYLMQILGRFSDRADALALADRIDTAVPCWTGDFTIKKEGSAGVFKTAFSGRDVWAVSCNLNFAARSDMTAAYVAGLTFA